MIYLNDKVLSSHCTVAVSNIDFILKADIYNMKSFSEAIDNGVGLDLNSLEKKSKVKYLSRLEINDYFDTWV